MADEIGVIVTGDREVALKFEQFPARAHDSLLARIRSLTSTLAARVRSAAPSKTGKLRSTIADAIYDDAPKKIVGRVFVNADYAKAGALEYGAHRRAKVGAHDAKLDHVWGRKLSAPTTVIVEAFTRRSNVVAKRFLRSSLTQMHGEIEAGLHEAVLKAAEDAGS